MNCQAYHINNGSFRVMIIFLLLLITGVALLPFLPARLTPPRQGKTISVSCSWRGGSAEQMESKVTSRIEALLATFPEIKQINSTSSLGYASISAEPEDVKKIRQLRYRIAAAVRQLHTGFPKEVSYPVVSDGSGSGTKAETLLSYAVTVREDDAVFLTAFFNNKLKPVILNIDGVSDVAMKQPLPYRFELQYDEAILKTLQINPDEIVNAINANLFRREAGQAMYTANKQRQYNYVVIQAAFANSEELENIQVKKTADRIIRVGDLAKVMYTQQPANGFSRNNGREVYPITVLADKSANFISLARKVDKEVARMCNSLPAKYAFKQTYNAADELGAELNKILYKSLATICLLLLFVFLASRSFKYLLLIAVSLLSTVIISFIFFYWLGLDIDLYSLAGITISMGMVIDGSIVMIDHLRTIGNKKVFLALAGAHLTSIGSVCVIFFINTGSQINLVHFAWAVILNLLVSLPVAYFLVPSLMSYIRMPVAFSGVSIHRRRKIIRISGVYTGFIKFILRYKRTSVALLVIAFGIPVFLLPNRIEDKGSWSKSYNETIGSSSIKPVLDKYLGGALGIFMRNKKLSVYNPESFDKTQLVVNAYMRKGTPLHYMDNTVRRIETFLGSFPEIDQYQSETYSGENANISITFKQQYEKGTFPHQLKRLLQTEANNNGLADFEIYGVGRGFSNVVSEQTSNYTIQLQGYNYDELQKIAILAKNILKENQRVQKVFIDNRSVTNEYENKVDYAYVFQPLHTGRLLLQNIPASHIGHSLMKMGKNEYSAVAIPYQDQQVSVVIKPSDANPPSVWQVMHGPVETDSGSFVRLHELATIEKERAPGSITKRNQQYQLAVNYYLIADPTLGSITYDTVKNRIERILPVGYSIDRGERGFWEQASSSQLVMAILITIAVIFIISAILLNSLSQSLVVIAMIPVSFIGVFLSTLFIDYKFDEGGYASFIVLSGLVVNWALFILNDYNNLKKSHSNGSSLKLYLKAFNYKILPVSLSALSAILGLVPFLVNSRNDPFWYALAIGCIGGILFSIFATVVCMPLFLLKKRRCEV